MSSSREMVWRINDSPLYCRTIILLLTTVVLVEQDAKLGQLCQTVRQLQEEEKKATREVAAL